MILATITGFFAIKNKKFGMVALSTMAGIAIIHWTLTVQKVGNPIVFWLCLMTLPAIASFLSYKYTKISEMTFTSLIGSLMVVYGINTFTSRIHSPYDLC